MCLWPLDFKFHHFKNLILVPVKSRSSEGFNRAGTGTGTSQKLPGLGRDRAGTGIPVGPYSWVTLRKRGDPPDE